MSDDDPVADEAFRVAMRILETVRLFPNHPRPSEGVLEERRWADEVNGMCHVWGDFYGPATSPWLARAIAHRYLDRQGGDLEHLKDALARYGTP